MRVLIIEDEAFAADRLEKILTEIEPGISVAAKLGSIKESAKWLSNNSVDLIFSDIQLSDGLSFSIFEQVPVQTPIIFTTAYDEYAIKAFQLNSIAYLLKPAQRKSLEESLQKYRSMKSAFGIDFDNLLAAVQGKKPEYRKRFLIQVADRFRKIEIEEIAFFYASEKSVFIKTFSGSTFPLDLSLDSLENCLDPLLFFRINRGYIISMKSIASMHAWSRSRVKVVLEPKCDDEMDSIVSIDRASDFKKWLNQ